MWVPSRKACKYFGVHPNTLRSWDKEGLIKTQRTPKGMRLYDISSINLKERKKICYARVSSRNQKEDLNSQIRHLQTRYPTHQLIEDTGSGLNFKRKGFNTLLDEILSGNVAEVVIAHRDRLCRFGFELIERIASKNNCTIVVLSESSLSPQEELVKDLLSIVHVFSCRIYGLRKYGNKIKEDKDLSKKHNTNT